MFVPSVRKLTAVVAGTLLVFTSAVACSSEPPVTDPYSDYNPDGSLKESPFAFLDSNKDEETTADSKDAQSREKSASGTRCLDLSVPFGDSFVGLRYPAKPDHPVLTPADIVDIGEKIKRTCGDQWYVDTAADYERWFCVGQEVGGGRLASALLEFRYFDGTEMSALQCENGQRIEPVFD